jgi:hypothetical protein
LHPMNVMNVSELSPPSRSPNGDAPTRRVVSVDEALSRGAAR